MAKKKRNKPKFWCPECRLVGYRTQELIQAKAQHHNKEVQVCPQGRGFHLKFETS
jgi:hypothetical protein